MFGYFNYASDRIGILCVTLMVREIFADQDFCKISNSQIYRKDKSWLKNSKTRFFAMKSPLCLIKNFQGTYYGLPNICN